MFKSFLKSFLVTFICLSLISSVSLLTFAAEGGGASPKDVETGGSVETGGNEETGGNALPSLEDDVRLIRQYIELTLFTLIPFTVATIIIALGCVWFHRTFIH